MVFQMVPIRESANMKAILTLFLAGLAFGARAQPDAGPNDRLPIVVTVQFHSLSVPFRQLKNNFRNVGIGIGTELRYGPRSAFYQRFALTWYRNRAVGNGWLAQTQAVWRPAIGADGFGEGRAGIGYLLSKRPTPAYRYRDGDWVAAGKKGRGLFTVPVGIGAGYRLGGSGDDDLSPFLGYEVLAISGYNRSIPLVTETLLQVGTRIENR